MPEVDPFETLGLGPTLQRDAIKQAYFAAVRRTPPHVDPEAFRRLRAAYEELSDGASLLRAWLRAPLEVDGELERWDARWQARIEAACEQQRGEVVAVRGVELLAERCFRTRIGLSLARFSDTACSS